MTELMLNTLTPFASGMNLTLTGISSPAAYALKGSVIEYMIFPGQVFSISSVWLNSKASGVKVRCRLKVRYAWKSFAKPDRKTLALSCTE